jgi:uncharacterized membrane protein
MSDMGVSLDPVTDPAPRTRAILRALLAAAYLAAGILHVAVPKPFLGITPAWVPYAPQVIAFTGLCEIAGAIGLFVPRLRWWAGVGLAAYAVCVYPANVKHALDYIDYGRGGLGLEYHIPRLLFQPVIVWWGLFAGRVIDWPFKRRMR